MTQPRAVVVFDLDGTLVDSRSDIAAAANYALAVHGFARHPEPVIGSFVGDGATQLLLRAAAIAADDPRLGPLLRTFLEYYGEHAAVRTSLMPHAHDALAALSDLPLALLTNKPRGPTVALLAALGQLQVFAQIIAGGDCPYLKPDPRPLQRIARELDCPIERVVLVGDGPQDVGCGRAAGAYTVGVRGGIASAESLVAASPDCIIDSLEELPSVVRTWLSQAGRT